ncbi:MAG: DUF3470 domain-containing protein [Gracilimonas sp.]|uniref:DUF3470 domain-containing protein n=1 Tax=Gracilimonas sp. TaxID=1974203 RepID=UPI003751CAD4|nr:DUF3470 domain-containing protein [Gracilimonas sp.]
MTYIALNERLSEEEWAEHVINEAKEPLPDWEQWSGRKDKRKHLIENRDEEIFQSPLIKLVNGNSVTS